MQDDPTAWQTPAALAVVALTLLIFTVRFLLRRRSKRKTAGCGGDCGCISTAEKTLLATSRLSKRNAQLSGES